MAQQINLFNPVFLKQKKYFAAVAMLQSLGLLLAGMIAFYGYARYESQTLSRASADSARQLTTQAAQIAKLTQEISPLGRSKLLEDEVARMAARLKQREEQLGVLRAGGLGNTAGFARYLAAFARQSLNGVWFTGLTISADEAELMISGRVLHPDLVPAYIRALNKEAVMRGRRVSELRLTAREERVAATAAPGANPAGASAPPAAPLRYVDFSVIASRATAPASAVTGGAAAAPAAATVAAGGPALGDLVPVLKAAK